ncbi:hypothetical protein Pcinc_038469 [Petrolisthes cinctipes]|uniref:PPIase cyclophilin-type domain-containing protein n=1 Tax=Petrolisthes cinctipes TaxID=88211 RepID=A0AAE1BRG5_PETCI|nr:hypothetical protein Pcinc_038469 [Petrolisthes cinctipes]
MTTCHSCSVGVKKMANIKPMTFPSYPANHQGSSVTDVPNKLPISHDIDELINQFSSLTLTESFPKAETARPPSLSEPGRTTRHRKSLRIKTKLKKRLDEQKALRVKGMMEGRQLVQSQLEQDSVKMDDSKSQHVHHQKDRLQHSPLERNQDAIIDLLEKESSRIISAQKTEGEIEDKEMKPMLGSMMEPLDTIQNERPIDLLEKESSRIISAQKTEGEKKYKEMKPVLIGSMEPLDTIQNKNGVNKQSDGCMNEAQVCDVPKCQQDTFPHVNTVTTSIQQTVLETTICETEATEYSYELVEPDQPLLMKKSPRLKKTKKKSVGHEVKAASNLQPTYLQAGYLYLMKKLVKTGKMFVVQENQYGLRRFARISDVMKAVDPSSTLTFLDLEWPGSRRRRIHIRLSPNTSAAGQFILLCTGQGRHSYLNTSMIGVGSRGNPGEFVLGGDYLCNNGKGGPPLLDHPKEVQYPSSGKAGVVWSYRLPWGSKSAQFCITTRGRTGQQERPYVFGMVESGLKVVKAAAKYTNIKEVVVVECGVVLSRW